MSRPPRDQDVLDSALQAIALATTIEQLRQAQAVVLPLQYGMSLEQTAQAIGLSKGWACRLRNQFIAGGAVVDKGKSVLRTSLACTSIRPSTRWCCVAMRKRRFRHLTVRSLAYPSSADEAEQ